MKKIILFVIIFWMIFAVIPLGTGITEGEQDSARAGGSGLTAHEPIYINGNAGFTSENGVVSGSGTESDPWIIEGWEINTSRDDAIRIRDTDAYFVVRDCEVHGGGETWFGVQLSGTGHGIVNNVTSYNNDGIDLYFSSNAQVTNCTVYNCFHGVDLRCSPNTKLRHNTIYNNKYNFDIQAWDISDCYHDIDTSNTINGKTIYYIIEQSMLIFDETMDIGYLGLVSCNNITIENLDLYGMILANTTYSTIFNVNSYNSSKGINLFCSSNNQISNCTVYNNSDGICLDDFTRNNIISNCNVYSNSMHGVSLQCFSNINIITGNQIYNNSYGIYLYCSSNNNVTSNQVYNNSDDGIWLSGSSNNTIIYCNITDNTDYGIYIYFADYPSNYNIFHHNNFINNSQNAYDPHTNYWDNSYPSGGNYWSDYTGEDVYSGVDQDEPGNDKIGDTPYNISGGSNKDYYPLMSPSIRAGALLNLSPIALFAYSPITPTIFDNVRFTDKSFDLDGDVVSWYWNFGDGINSTEKNPTHRYSSFGRYTVTLFVTDNDNNPNEYSRSITVILNNPPTLSNGSVSPLYGYLDTVFQFNVTYTDADGDESAYVKVVIDSSAYNMTKQNDSDNNYTDGCIYEYSTKLTEGWHSYSFEASDGTDINKTATIHGIRVTEKEKEGKGVPQVQVVYYIILVTIIITVEIVGSVIFLKKRKRSMSLKCPKCSTIFKVKRKKEPFKAECPTCGATGTIGKSKAEEKNLPEKIAPTRNLRCPKCKKTFTVEEKEKPFKVKCPHCGKEGTIK